MAWKSDSGNPDVCHYICAFLCFGYQWKKLWRIFQFVFIGIFCSGRRKSTGIFRQISYDFSGCWGWIYDVYGCFSNIIPIRNYVKSIFCFLFVPSVPSHSYRLLCVAKWLILRASIYHYFSWRFSRKCFSV